MKASPVPPTLGFLIWFLCIATAQAGEQQAQARVWCESLHFSQGQYAGDTLDLSTVSGTPNGELSPYDANNSVSGFVLDFSGMGIYGTLLVGMPPFADADRDGFDDFYDSWQGVYGMTSGTYETPVSTGTITATWNRPAGSKDGTCVLKLVDTIYGALGDFTHSFELLEYRGSLFYTPGSTTVSNRLMVVQTGTPEGVFTGTFTLTKSSTDRFNKLSLPAGALTNTLLGTLSFAESSVIRETPWPTNYYAYIDFVDGDLRTSEPDYLYWTMSIDDLNDSNGNSIPDFSDDVVVQPPKLSISAAGSGVTLRITGATGRTYSLQESISLLPGSWTTISNFVTSNSPYSISRPQPVANMFWRVGMQ